MFQSVISLLAFVAFGVCEDPDPQSPAERYEALLDQYDRPFERPRGEYINNPERFRVAAEPFLELARDHQDDPIAFDALAWVVMHAVFQPANATAMKMLAEDHLDDERLARLIENLDQLYGDPFEAKEHLLLAALKSRHHETRGWAHLGLARELMDKIQQTRRFAVGHQLFLEGTSIQFWPEPELSEDDLERIADEAEGLLNQVIDRFGDINAWAREDRTLGQLAEGDLRELREVSVGEVAPEIVGEDVFGNPLRLSDHRGKVIMLTFSGDWCGPCVAMYPSNREKVERWSDRPFALLSVSTDTTKDSLREAIESGKITWPCWYDGPYGGPIREQWNVSGFPTVYLIDHRGVIRYKNPVGGRDELLERLITEAEEADPEP